MLKCIFNKIKSFIFVILFLASPGYCANIIFDLGGVLINTSSLKAFRQLGFGNLLRFTLHLNNPLRLRYTLFDILEKIEAECPNTGAQDDKGKELPPIMCDWLAGFKTNSQIKDQIHSFIDQNPEAFNNNSEKQIIKTIITIMFTPKELTKTRTIIKEGFKFVKKCKEQGHELYILSNWDKESFELMREKFFELFDLFDEDNIIISGQIGLLKPDPKIYKYFLTKYNLDPQTCIFYDDQEINVKAAQKVGIHGVVCKNPSYKDMVNELDLFMDGATEPEYETNS